MSYQNNIVVLNNKSTVLAYVLWFLLGNFGVHRYYLDSVPLGLVQLGLAVVGGATVWLIIGWFLLIPLWIWLIIDLFWIPARTGALNNHAINRLNRFN